MTKFNPENKQLLTYGESLDPAMGIIDQSDADQYLAAYVKYIESNFNDASGNQTPMEVAKINLAYYAGYYGDETRERVERLFKCAHPVFGSVDDNGHPSPSEAFKCGREGKTLNEIRK